MDLRLNLDSSLFCLKIKQTDCFILIKEGRNKVEMKFVPFEPTSSFILDPRNNLFFMKINWGLPEENIYTE
jgi:hypothetical protein